jgi:hypothetical protein
MQKLEGDMKYDTLAYLGVCHVLYRVCLRVS